MHQYSSISLLPIGNLDTREQVGMACLCFTVSGAPAQMTSTAESWSRWEWLATLHLSSCSLSPWTSHRLADLFTWTLRTSKDRKWKVSVSSDLSLATSMLSLRPYSVGQSSHKATQIQGEGTQPHFSVGVALRNLWPYSTKETKKLRKRKPGNTEEIQRQFLR